MTTVRSIEFLASICLFVIGLSHALQPRAWIRYFIALRDQGTIGVYTAAFSNLWFGSLIVAFHPVWSGLPLLLTLLGCAQILKAGIYFCFPEFGLRQLEIPRIDRPGQFVAAGGVLLVIAMVLAWHLLHGR